MRLALLLVLIALGCAPTPDDVARGTVESSLPSDSLVARGPVRTGAHLLAGGGVTLPGGPRVGLIVNHTAMVDSVHLIDVVSAAPGLEVTALFGPEHGIRGEADAGETVRDGRDVETGAPIYSLYGPTRRPTSEMLEDVDVLVFDIQDVGARFYTYISTMGLSMQAAAEQGIPFVVLDRPNPIGGNYVSGYVLEEGFESFVGQYRIPVAHGLTVGELARMIQGEGLLPGLEDLDLHVVAMEGWTRDMLWPETGLPWIAPSPNIPTFETALVYPGTCFFEATSASEGRGTREPFLQLGARSADGERIAATMNELSVSGLRFEPVSFTPISIPGMAAEPKLQDVPLEGVRIQVTDAAAVRPVEAGIHLLHAFGSEPGMTWDRFVDRTETMGRLAGTDRLYDQLRSGATPEQVIASWEAEVAQFRSRRAPYLLYE